MRLRKVILAALFVATPSFAESLPPSLMRWLDPAWSVTEMRWRTNAEALARLPAVPHNQPTARLGYHGVFAREAITAKWLQVDLGQRAEFDAVALIAAEAAEDATPGPGYGFPQRFRVEADDDEHFASPRLLADFTEADFPNPGTLPVFLSCRASQARYVRMTATRLWSRGDRWLFALGELMVLHGPRNLAAGCPVRAIDSYNAPPAWQPENVTDGFTALGAPVGSAPSKSNGWHSGISRTPDVEKWVQVNLPRAVPLSEVRLYPARPADFPTRSGFGFPVRFRVEISAEENFAQPQTLLDSTDRDFSNPGENPVTISGDDRLARSIRVTATKLWERNADFVFALAELEAWSGGENIAREGSVTSSDVTLTHAWTSPALIDGATSRWQIAGWPGWLRGLSERRELQNQQALLEIELARLNRSAMRRAVRWTAGVAGLVLVLALAWMQHTRRRRALANERLRERIAADLHDEIGSQLASIALLSQVEQRKGGSAAFAEINDIARETSAAMRDIVWLVRPSPGSVGDLVLRLREVAGRLLGNVTWQLHTDSLPKFLPLEVRRHVYLFAREALRNAAIHAKASTVEIRFTSAADQLRLEVVDDGVGFQTDAAVSGTGLISLRQRAAALGGEIEIDSAPHKGTRIALVVPLKHR